MTMTSRQKEASSLTGSHSVRGNKRQCLSAQMVSFTGAASWAPNLQCGLRANLQFIHTDLGSKAKSSSLSAKEQRA